MSPKKRIAITILALIGLLLSFKLVHIYFVNNFVDNAPKSFCSINSLIDCDGVSQTTKAFFLGVPLAIWGVILYLLFLFLTYVDKIREKINFPLLNVFKNPTSYIAAIGLFSFCISMVLAYISFFDIKKICILCFATYIINFLIALCAVKKNFFITDIKNTVLDFISGAKEYLTLFLAVCIVLVLSLGYLDRSLVLAPNIKANKSINEFQKLKTNIYAAKGNDLGNVDGDVSIYVFGDFMCPFCKVMNVMLHKLVLDDKKVAVYHINFPLDSACNPTVTKKIHPGACILSKYALAAQNQGNYWGMVSLIYNNMPAMNSENSLLDQAKALGFDTDKLYKDAHSKQIDEYLENQIYRGIGEKIVGTPTIMIDGIPHSEVMPYFKLQEYVKQSRARHARENRK